MTALYVDTKKAAQILSVSVSFLNHARIKGSGPKFYRFGRLVRYALSDLANWAEAQNRLSTGPRA